MSDVLDELARHVRERPSANLRERMADGIAFATFALLAASLDEPSRPRSAQMWNASKMSLSTPFPLVEDREP